MEDYKEGFKKWRESIIKSPLDHHLGHHHSLLVSHGNHYNEAK